MHIAALNSSHGIYLHIDHSRPLLTEGYPASCCQRARAVDIIRLPAKCLHHHVIPAYCSRRVDRQELYVSRHQSQHRAFAHSTGFGAYNTYAEVHQSALRPSMHLTWLISDKHTLIYLHTYACYRHTLRYTSNTAQGCLASTTVKVTVHWTAFRQSWQVLSLQQNAGGVPDFALGTKKVGSGSSSKPAAVAPLWAASRSCCCRRSPP